MQGLAGTATKTASGPMLAFAGAGLDRAAHLRDDASRIADLLAGGHILPMWQGKPLTVAGGGLGWVASDHAVLDGSQPAVFLGIDGGIGLFAADISHWTPDEGFGAEAGFFDPTEQRHPAMPPDHVFVELRGLMTRLAPPDAERAATARALLHWHRSHGFCAACGARSVPAHAGWRRDCPACGAHHFPRTDPVVIMLVVRGNRLLLGRSPGWPDRMFSCLAGFVEPGETLEAAVRREVLEETGVRTGAVRLIASQPWPFPASLMIGCLAEATSDAIVVDPAEIAEALWLSREDLVAVFAGSHPRVSPPREGAIAQWLIANWLADRLDAVADRGCVPADPS